MSWWRSWLRYCGTDSEVVALLKEIKFQGTQIMSTLQDIIDNEASEATALSILATAVQTLLDTLKTLQQQLENSPTPAQIDAALAASKANSDAVAATIAKLQP